MSTLRESAIALIFNSDNHLLLVEQSYGAKWAIPCGLIEPGEGPHDAVLREIREEIGVAAQIERLFGLYDVLYPGFPRTLVYIFICSIADTPRIAQPQEVLSIAWYGLETLPNNLVPLIPYIRQDYLKRNSGTVRVIDFETL